MVHYKLGTPCAWLKQCTKNLNPNIWTELFKEKIVEETSNKSVLEMLDFLDQKTPGPSMPRKGLENAPRGKKRPAPKERDESVKKVLFEETCEGCEKGWGGQHAHSCCNYGDLGDEFDEEMVAEVEIPTTSVGQKEKDYRTVSTPWWERNRPDNTIPAEDTQSGDAEEFMSAFNTDGWSALHTGETWGFTWVQSSKLWFPAMEYSMMRTVKIGNEDPLNIQSMVGEVGPWNQGQSTNEWIPTNTGEWPASVEGAMKNPFTGDFTQTSKMVTTMLPFHSNSPPPIACIRSPKLLKSNDSPMKLTFQITCTYHCVIELERYDGGPQNAGFMPNVRYTEFKNAGSNREVGIQGAYPSKMTSLNSWPYNQRVYQGTHSETPRPLTK